MILPKEGRTAMNFQQLKYFVEISRFLSFSKAAKHLGLAQSALSYGMASLEEELRVRLLARDTHSVRLTPAGTVFLKDVEEILSRMDNAVEKARNVDAGFSGTLRIAFLSSVLKRYYSEWVPPFKERFPNVNLVIGQLPMALIRGSLLDGTVDVAFTRSFDVESFSQLDTIPIYNETCTLVLHKDHPLANVEQLDYSLLADEPFVTMAPEANPGWHSKVMNICASMGFEPHIVQAPHSMEAIYNLLEFGMGVGILPSEHNLFDMPHLVMRPLSDLPGTSFQVVAAWRKDNMNPIMPLFLSELSPARLGIEC